MAVDITLYPTYTTATIFSNPNFQGDYDSRSKIEAILSFELNQLSLIFSPTSSWLSRLERWLRRVELFHNIYKTRHKPMPDGRWVTVGPSRHEVWGIVHKGKLICRIHYTITESGDSQSFRVWEEKIA